MQEELYGRAGKATANYVNAPSRFQSKNTRWEFNVEKANKVLDDAGWMRRGRRPRQGRQAAEAPAPDLDDPLRQT